MILNIIRAEFLKYKKFYTIKILFVLSFVLAGLLFYSVIPSYDNDIYRFFTMLYMFNGYLLVIAYLADYLLKYDSDKWNILLSKNIRLKYIMRKIITISYFAFIGLIILYLFISVTLNKIDPNVFNISGILQLFLINFLILVPFIVFISVISSFSKIFLSTTITLILLFLLPFVTLILGKFVNSDRDKVNPVIVNIYDYSTIIDTYNPAKLLNYQFISFLNVNAKDYLNEKTINKITIACSNQLNKTIQELINNEKRYENEKNIFSDWIEPNKKELKETRKNRDKIINECMNSKKAELVYLFSGFDIKKYFTSDKNNTFFYLWIMYNVSFIGFGAYLMNRKEKN